MTTLPRFGRRTIGRRAFDFDRQAAVMAVVNRTPDSFWDRGRTYELDAAVSAALSAADAGADWVDIGGMPFSPDTPEVSEAEEVDRVVPVVERVAAASDVVISVDTTRVGVAERALSAGASVINDTSGLADPGLAELAADTGATLIITHSLAAPHVHHPRPRYDDVVTEVVAFLADRLERARDLGVRDEQVILDPGHDLNKNTRHTLELTRRFGEVVALGLPTLAAVSNKDFIGEALGHDREERTFGSVVAATWCIQQGARVIRMHDARAAVDTVRMCAAIAGTREPAYERHNL
ncbi:dihydropteroate synthase [Raineyella antarctica]|uniref:Dihydropteroate synthase n=1 Tax=Raineyella antarctica TaxID=1577474 RepID=A0A1G6H508_9ACTN|nr:dihydropteroate synthase [Raineyella antarctica]SDB89253.1 dihydropteroate synthase [Raineyella antarctica]